MDLSFLSSLKNLRATLSLSYILSSRMLGLFLIYPIFSLYANNYTHTTPTLIGIALGIYGLTQALFQLPLGVLSDRFGRKPIIIIGLLIFGIGSMIAASSQSIYGIITGRALQGAGAIGSTIMAFTADLTEVENRTTAMAILGLSIGTSFAFAMILGPILNNWIHLQGIFWVTAFCAFSGILVLHYGVPNSSPKLISHYVAEPMWLRIKTSLTKLDLLRINLGILILHMILTASFIAIPLLLGETMHMTSNDQWRIYLPILVLAFLTSLPFIRITEKKPITKQILCLSVFAIAWAELELFLYSSSRFSIMMALFIFFTGFTLLEALLPSLISKFAPPTNKGSAIGVFSSFQFFGIFLGGTLGGFIYNHYQFKAIFLFSMILASIWLLTTITMESPPHLKTRLLRIKKGMNKLQAGQLSESLQTVPGIFEACISIEESIAYLRVDNKILSKESLQLATQKIYGVECVV